MSTLTSSCVQSLSFELSNLFRPINERKIWIKNFRNPYQKRSRMVASWGSKRSSQKVSVFFRGAVLFHFTNTVYFYLLDHPIILPPSRPPTNLTTMEEGVKLVLFDDSRHDCAAASKHKERSCGLVFKTDVVNVFDVQTCDEFSYIGNLKAHLKLKEN